jgi:hypothetical protein
MVDECEEVVLSAEGVGILMESMTCVHGDDALRYVRSRVVGR